MTGAKNAGVRPNPYAGSSGPVRPDWKTWRDHGGIFRVRQSIEARQSRETEPGGRRHFSAVKQRLGTAAKLKGKQLVVKRVDDDICFWEAKTAGQTAQKLAKQATDIELPTQFFGRIVTYWFQPALLALHCLA